jgi:hypothetical protein
MSVELFQAIWPAGNMTPDVEAALDREFPFYPLTAPGMPLPGPNFIAEAQRMGDPYPTITGTKENKRVESHGEWLTYFYRRALYDADLRLNVSVRGTLTSQLRLFPGICCRIRLPS